MINKLTDKDLRMAYLILKAYKENQIIDKPGEWEEDYYGEKIIDLKEINSVIKKLKSILPREIMGEINKKILVRKYSDWTNVARSSIINKVEKAFQNDQTLEIEYFNLDEGESVKRAVDIYAKNVRYIVGYCHLRKAIRKFRISRIVKAKVLEKTYKIPDNFNKKDYL